jgi:hypothetical protein
MSSDLLGTIVLDGQRLGACYFPAMPAADQLLQANGVTYRIVSVVWVTPSFEAGRGLAEIVIDVAPAAP